MPTTKSDLPFGSEFSPSQIDLATVLECAHTHGGNWKAFEAAVRQRYFESHRTSDYNKGKLANNTKLGMIAYGIIDRQARLTPFGRQLYQARRDTRLLHDILARHVLLNLKGLTLIQCVQDMQVAGEKVDLVKLRQWLGERGVYFPRGGKHPSIMRLWLERAGVFAPGTWRVDEARLHAVLGTGTREVEALSSLTREQRAFMKALANIGTHGPVASNDVEKLATATYGVPFNEKNLPKTVLYPLRDAGYLLMDRGTKEYGRGAKPFILTCTDKVTADLVTPILDQLGKQVGTDIRPLLRRPFQDILKELKAKNKHHRGLALEALAFKLMRLIGLTYVATRLRGTATGGAEVDLIFDSDRLVFSRWQIQCKNTAQGVSVDDVAKEVGLTHALKSNAIVVASTGKISSEARRYADKIMTDSNLAVVLMDRQDLEMIRKNPPAILDVLAREAKHAMKLKKLDI